MKKILLFSWFSFIFYLLAAQDVRWTWINGDNEINQPGIYKEKGSIDISNKPGARYSAVKWTDLSGNHWLFGGYGYAASGIGNLNDLWKYNAVTNLWTWISGDNTISVIGSPGNYGIKGVAASANLPAGRNGSTGWIDASGNLWLFGGDGFYNRDDLRFNDLWKFDLTTGLWTWVSGDNIGFQPGVYGIKGIADASNKPGARTQSVSWTDDSGNLWLFGGNGIDKNNECGLLSDLWKFDPVAKQWTWISGDNSINQYGVYRTKGIPAPENKPGGRMGSVSWTDASGNFWLFGGIGYAANRSGYLNDLWKFDPNTRLWTWVKGDNTFNEQDIFGIEGKADPANKPGGRAYAATWISASGNLCMFAGLVNPGSGNDLVNDVWSYNISTNMWTWESGDKAINHPGIYGIKGKDSESNKAGSRISPLCWTDILGNVYMFGGSGFASNINHYLNDVWKFFILKHLIPL